MSENTENVDTADPNASIAEALKSVLGLFDIKKDIDILHQNSLDDDIGSLVDKYKNNGGKDKNNFIIVYFDSRKDKWVRDTHRFWHSYFEYLGIGYYAGNNVIQLVNQLNKSQSSINPCKFTERHFNYLNQIFKSIKKRAKSTADKVRMINNPDYSINKVKHGNKKKDKVEIKLSYIISALRESLLWGFKKQNIGRRYNILIIDDIQFGKEGNVTEDVKILFNICRKLEINCYTLFRPSINEKDFNVAIYNVLNDKDAQKYFKKVALCNYTPSIVVLDKHEKEYFRCIMNFDYLLVDIWHDESNAMGGLKLISAFQHKIEEDARKRVLTFKYEKEEAIDIQHKIKERVEKDVLLHKGKITKEKELISKLQNGIEEEFTFHNSDKQKKEDKSVVPEIFAYTFIDDAETIQMARRMGASGYVNKNCSEGIALSIVRAGPPLESKDATRLDYLITNNFPCIASLPRQIVKHLFDSKIAVPNTDGQVKKSDDLVWIRSIPKADNHVHFGTAIPLQWCYILSLISLFHWNNYWEKHGKEKYKKYKDKVTEITDGISRIIQNTLTPSEDNKIALKEVGFRRRFLHFFSKEYNTAEVVFLKDVINYLVSISDDILNDKQIACLINVLIGCIKFDEIKWRELYKEASDRINDLKEETENGSTEIRNIKLFRDCAHFIKNISLPKVDELKIAAVYTVINRCAKIFEADFDPLSEMLSIGEADRPYGLERYLASTSLVGSSLLQFADTVLLASMSIPEWAAAKKAKNNDDTKKHPKGNKNEGNSDNVIHLELRTTPQGFLNPYDSEKSNSTLASKLICVGLEFGIKKLLKTPDPVTANLLISIKRDRDRKDIIPCINTAVDLRDEYLKYIKDNNISEAEGYMIPHVSGLDVAGIERNNLPAELHPFYKEAFERCLLSTIHAGETERAQSVKDAIFMLNASRIGHGLSIQQDEDLKQLISERRICVELCPRSNQFTNGFKVFLKEATGDKDGIHQNEYVYNHDDFRGKMLLSINTDNPTISHKTSDRESFAYPLSEEFIWLSGMINDKKQIPLSRLEVLSLIYNGFVSMFAPEQAKKSIISFADQEVLSILAAEYLDIGKD